MLFMITLAIMRFSTPTGLAANNQSITSSGIGDLKPFLTAVGLLMGMFIAAIFVVAHGCKKPDEKAHESKEGIEEAKQQQRSIDEINRELEKIRKTLR